MAGTAVEAAANVGVGGPAGAPLQDPALHWPQRFVIRPDAGSGHLCVCNHPVDELRLAPETAGDLDVIDAIGDEAQHTAPTGLKEFVITHGPVTLRAPLGRSHNPELSMVVRCAHGP